MSQTIQGTYKNGVVQLDVLPDGVTEARVLVNFVDQSPTQAADGKESKLKFGMFFKPDRPFTSDDDLESAKQSWNRKVE